MTGRRYRVHGRVQGVGFRWFVVRLGRSCGVTGGVRNEADGSVTVVAQGDAESLAGFLAGLEQGPPAARVERVEETDAAGPTAASLYDATF